MSSGNPYQTIAPGPTDALAAIATAIGNLPLSGGCVDARQLTGNFTGAATVNIDRPVTLLLGPMQIQVSANPGFLIQGNNKMPPSPIVSLTVLGLDPNASVIVAQPNVTLFKVAGSFFPAVDFVGGETLTIKRCGLCGGNPGQNGSGDSGTVAVDTQNYPTTNFEQGLLLIEDNLITNFGDTALKIGVSVYFNRIHRNQFLCNARAIYLDNNTETSITENNFIQGTSGEPTLTCIGPMHRIVHNYFFRNELQDMGHAPDILLLPESSWSGQAGGYIWIEDNRFSSELENLDPARRRILLKGSYYSANPPDNLVVAGPAIIRGNQFFGPAVPCTITAQGGTATVTLSGVCPTNGLAPLVMVTIYNAANPQLNGTFPIASVVSAVPPALPNQFTYAVPSVSATNVAAWVRLAATAAIETDNPHLAWDVHGNFFANYGVLIADNENPPYQPQNAAYGWGESLFVDNRVLCPNNGYQVFANGGNNFTWIRPPASSTLPPTDPWPKQTGARSLGNRVKQSEYLNLWASNGILVSPGQPDPFGTTRGFQLTLNATFANQNIASPTIDLTGLTTASRLVIKFWAKQGSLTSLMVGLRANGMYWYGNLFPLTLGPDWKQYKFVTNQLYSMGDTYALAFYPGDTAVTSGTLYLFAPQISDDDADYYPTGSSPVSDSSSGNRFEKAIILTSLKTTTHTGDPSSGPTVTATTNLGTGGSAALQGGSTDFSGVIVLTAGTGAKNSGQVVLTFNVPYVGTNTPVLVASLQDGGANSWSPGTSQVRVVSTSNQSCVLAWVNGAALTASQSYAISYVVIGRG
jgi:hypothetical protein